MGLVNEKYIPDCIKDRFLNDSDHPLYYVEGYKETNAKEEPVARIASSSDASLQVKPDKHAVARVPHTPSRTDGSDERESLGQAEQLAEIRAQEEQRIRDQNARPTSDALDDAIAEVSKAKDLVSTSCCT